MSIDMENVYRITNGSDEYKEISQNGTTVWERAISTPAPQNTNFAPTRSGNALGVAITGNSKQGQLPDGYTQLEYIKGNGSAYINTGLTSYKNTYTYKLGIKRYSTATKFVSFQNPETASRDIGMFAYSAGFNFQNGSGTRQQLTMDTTDFHDVIIESDGYTIDSVKTSITASAEFTVSLPLYLFTGTDKTTGVIDTRKSVDAISYFKIYDENNVLMLDFIPAKNSSNVLGMYDLVSGQFFTNAGTGSFIAGSEVKPTPTNPIEVKGVGRGVLPSGYTQLECIQSSGSQYIDTGIQANPAYTNSKMQVMLTGTSGTTGLFGARSAASSSTRSHNIFGNVSGAAGRFDNVNPSYPYVFTADTWYDIELGHNGLKGTVTVDGTLVKTGAQNMTNENIGNIFIGNFYNNTAAFSSGTPSKWGEVKIWQDGTTLSGHFIPAKNSSNVVGMYDLVSNTFFTNAGSGDFTAGPEVASCTLPITVGSTTYSPAIATPLQKVGTYADSISGSVLTRGVGVKVFDGTESWSYNSSSAYFTGGSISDLLLPNTCICTHYEGISSSKGASQMENNQIKLGYGGSKTPYLKDTRFTTAADLQAYLAAQYAAGTPVTVYYPLATPTTESFTQPAIPLTKATTYQWELDTEISPTTSSLNYLGKEGA